MTSSNPDESENSASVNEAKDVDPLKSEAGIFVPLHSDDLLEMRKYSKLVCIFVELAMLSQLCNTMIMIYAGAAPLIKSCNNITFLSNHDACQNFHYCQNDSHIVFERQFYGITEEFKLLCDDAKYEKMGISLQMIGLMLGCLFFGQIGDLYGRKRPMLICLIMCAILGFISAFSKSFIIFTTLRTILSFFNGGQSTLSVVYMIENVPKRSRMYLSTLISYSPNVVLLGIIAYIFQDWVTLSIVISILTLPAILILIFLNESPRWLMQKGKVEEAKKVHLAIYKFDNFKNGLTEQELNDLLVDEHKQYSENAGSQHSFWHLFSTKQTAVGTFVVAFTFFSTTTINYSNMFNLGSVSGSLYINSILIGLLRYTVSICCGFFDYQFLWFNRKKAHGLCTMWTIVSILTILFIYLTDSSETFGAVVRFCVLASCAMTSQAIIVGSVTSNELMPTAIRSLSYSIAQLSARFGMVFSPHIFYLNLYLGNHVITLPYFILLMLAVADLLFFRYLIPETKNKPLEDHIKISKPTTEEIEVIKMTKCDLHSTK